MALRPTRISTKVPSLIAIWTLAQRLFRRRGFALHGLVSTWTARSIAPDQPPCYTTESPPACPVRPPHHDNSDLRATSGPAESPDRLLCETSVRLRPGSSLHLRPLADSPRIAIGPLPSLPRRRPALWPPAAGTLS